MENFFFAFLDELGHLEAKKRIVEMMENDRKSDSPHSIICFFFSARCIVFISKERILYINQIIITK